ncbi:MAG: host attachment protein [Betaproteobacteria bacterium]|nr:MAG: host attachment protein [Betaproteobacteria bacterium]
MTRITCSDVIGVAQAPFGVLHLVARTRPAAAAALRVQEIHRQSTGGGAGKDPVHSALLGKKPASRTFMTTTWIIAADASRARILQVTDRAQQLEEVENLLNPEGRVHDRELISDAHPRLSSHSGGGPGSDREETSAAEHATELFAKRVGNYLESARTAHRYDRLHLIAPPKFLGRLRKELGKEVQKLVAEELPKDLSWLNARDIQAQYLNRR